jgi:hypothetical protein
MKLRVEGHTKCYANDGFSSTAYATCPRFTEVVRCCKAPAVVVGVAEGGAQGGRAVAGTGGATHKATWALAHLACLFLL